jgi:aromatic-L-amino-acid/L-tryptophan decarboxylase
MHSVDATTESMIRSVLAYAENRMRLDPVPLDRGSRDPAELEAAVRGLLGPEPHNPDQVLGVYTSVIAPAVISADSPRFLGFIPAAPTKASLLFDMLISCASIQGISWLEAAGAIHAENQALRLIALDGPGPPDPRPDGLADQLNRRCSSSSTTSAPTRIAASLSSDRATSSATSFTAASRT